MHELPSEIGGSGVGGTWEAAFVAAIGEVVERSSLIWNDPEGQICSTYKELGDRSISIDCINPFAPEQYAETGFPFRRFDELEMLNWLPCRSLLRDEEVLVPAEIVHIGHHSASGKHLYGTSNGVAAALTIEEALASALYEVIERDAFMQAWYCRRPGKARDPLIFADPEISEVVRRCEASGNRLILREITTDIGVPVYLAILEARNGTPAIALGAAARIDPREAARKAIYESAHTWNWAKEQVERRGMLMTADEVSEFKIRGFDDHVYLYSHVSMKSRLEFFLSDDETSPPREFRSCSTALGEIRSLVRSLESCGLEPFAIEITRPEYRALGYHVVRAIVPGAIPLAMGAGPPYLASSRIHRPLCSINLEPHPFP